MLCCDNVKYAVSCQEVSVIDSNYGYVAHGRGYILARPLAMAIHLATCTCELLVLGKLIWASIPKF